MSASELTTVPEDPHIPERLVVAPAPGVFTPRPVETATSEGEIVHTGQVLGSIDRNEGTTHVVCPHSGFLMGLLVLPGERVRHGQALAWVRVFS
jgi:biotin carboxyl carrier protein